MLGSSEISKTAGRLFRHSTDSSFSGRALCDSRHFDTQSSRRIRVSNEDGLKTVLHVSSLANGIATGRSCNPVETALLSNLLGLLQPQ